MEMNTPRALGASPEQNVFQLCHVVRNMRRPGDGQLILRAVAVTDADGIHAVRLPALDVKAAVADHHDAAAEGLRAPADKRRLAGILVVHPGPITSSRYGARPNF